MMTMKSLVALVVVPFLLTGCLQTRSNVREQEEKQVLRKQVANLQTMTADVNARFQEAEDDIRRQNGKIETFEAKLQQLGSRSDKNDLALEEKMKQDGDAYREEFTKLRTEIEQLRGQVVAMQEDQQRAAQAQADAKAKAAAASAKGPFASAEDNFESKNWKEAILDYEKYRKRNPKGKQLATATYKIGVSFQELGLAEDAKVFFEEVLSKYPKSKEAAKASSRLKALKK